MLRGVAALSRRRQTLCSCRSSAIAAWLQSQPLGRAPWPAGRRYASSKSAPVQLQQQQQVAAIRNVGILAHIDAGKTTTSEYMLFLSGKISSAGNVDNGNTVMDFLPQERERGITISAAAITFDWKDHTINLIDTPGHVDFSIEVESATHALDGCVVLIDGVAGVQCQTKSVWNRISSRKLPAISFVNKMDRVGADLERSIRSLREQLGANPVALQYPLFQQEELVGYVDLISQTVFERDTATISRLTPEHDAFEDIQIQRRMLLERIAEVDEVFLDLFLSSDPSAIPVRDILAALRRACLERQLLPVLCGTSLKGIGVNTLLDAMIALLPSPLDVPKLTLVNRSTGASKTIIALDRGLCALVFKVVHDRMRGFMAYARVFSGTLRSKDHLYNSVADKPERVAQLLAINGEDFDPIAEAGPGSVCCLIGLKATRSGDTLCTEGSERKHYSLEGLHVPQPVFSMAIEPETEKELKPLMEALNILCIEDPSLNAMVDPESGQILLQGLGELHLEIVTDKLLTQHKLKVYKGRTYIAYRETLTSYQDKPLAYSARYDKTIDGKHLFAGFDLRITSLSLSSAPEWVISPGVKAALLPEELSALEDSVRNSLARGPKGFPVMGIKLEVLRAFKSPSSTTPGAIRACISSGFAKALGGEGHMLLEPRMTMEIDVPDKYVGSLMVDLTGKRRAHHVEVFSSSSGNSTIVAQVPFASTIGYATVLRSLSQGYANFTSEYLCHDVVEAAFVVN